MSALCAVAVFSRASGSMMVWTPIMVTSMPFPASFSVGFFHAIQNFFQILDTGGLLPHQGKHFSEQVGVSLKVDFNPGGNHVFP